jgi:hypothetical protein
MRRPCDRTFSFNPGKTFPTILGAKTWTVIAGLLVLIAFIVDYSRLRRRQREAWTLLEIGE